MMEQAAIKRAKFDNAAAAARPLRNSPTGNYHRLTRSAGQRKRKREIERVYHGNELCMRATVHICLLQILQRGVFFYIFSFKANIFFKTKKTVKKLFIFFTVFYFLHRFQLCTIFIYFFSLVFTVKKAFQKTKYITLPQC
jgi:hypothetical protein